MKTKYRTTGHDIAPAPMGHAVVEDGGQTGTLWHAYARKPKAEDAPGVIKPGRLAIYDAGPKGDGKGRRHRGTVGPRATAATAARFIGQYGAKLGTGPNGEQAWLGPTLAEVSAQGSATPGANGDTLADESSRGATATQIKGA